MRTTAASALISLCLGATMLFSAGCGTLASDQRIPDGATQARNYSSVAGDIEVGRQASIRDASTVAGDIDIAEGSRVRSLSSVAGNIRVEANVQVEGSIDTVAGDIEIARGCTIAGEVGSVAGRITIGGSVVTGNVTTTAGRVDLTGTKVGGILRVRKSHDAGAHPARINLGPDCEVPEVVVEKNAEVRLRIHRSARVGAVNGAQAEYYD